MKLTSKNVVRWLKCHAVHSLQQLRGLHWVRRPEGGNDGKLKERRTQSGDILLPSPHSQLIGRLGKRGESGRLARNSQVECSEHWANQQKSLQLLPCGSWVMGRLKYKYLITFRHSQPSCPNLVPLYAIVQLNCIEIYDVRKGKA